MPYARNREHPEAMLKVLLTVIEKTSSGGATLDDLKEAYREVKDREPADKTIHRLIRRINLLFDPLAYDREEEEPEERAIAVRKRDGRAVYVFTRDLHAGPRLDPGLALLTALSLYPQQRHLLPDQFEVIMKLVLEGILQKMAGWYLVRREIEKYVYVSGYGPVSPRQNLNLLEKLLFALRHKKKVRFVYHRSYDGKSTTRELEPYGLLCRHNVWYLVGRCGEAGERRVFRLDHIGRLEIIENSIYTIPPDFSLKEAYGDAWGVWTEAEPDPPVTVRLRVAPGLAQKFRVTRYHESQATENLPDGGLEVRFRVTGAQEMIPWLMMWGSSLEVLEPDWLRQALADNLAETLGLYRKSAGENFENPGEIPPVLDD